MDEYKYRGKLVARRIRQIPKGSVPLTGESEPLQVVTLKHRKGAYLQAHTHKPKKRVTHRLQECLFIKKGRVKIDLYGYDGVMFKHLFLKAGEALLMINGGLGIHIIDDAEVLEFKNGPFVEDKVLL